ncbi:DUF6232 family protein [Lentzea sp. NPDC058450]|uniref:DUF6232 family protein n=1 Tax=Lentzea sp. NPDC058450 TaxID=3346505 RepID=UPI00364726D7
MARDKVAEIRINPRTVRIGHQVYPLANISRVQTLEVRWGGRKATSYPPKETAVLLLLFGLVAVAIQVGVPALGLGGRQLITDLMMGAMVLFGVRIAYLVLAFLYRVLFRRKHYALLLETAGTQYTALSGTDLPELRRIEAEIVGAIEKPPTREHVVEVHGDLVLGNQTKQTGSGSRMTINN